MQQKSSTEMNLEEVNRKLVALLGNATSIRGELSPCPEYFKDISESVESLILAIRRVETQLWQQARLGKREQAELPQTISHLSSTLENFTELLAQYRKPHPIFPSLDVWNSAAWQDQKSRDVGELQRQIVTGRTVLDTLVKEMQQEVEQEPKKLAHFESWMAIQMATKDFGICPNRLWAIARGHQDGSLTKLIRPLRDNEPMLGHADHEQCNYELCEHSRRDFTWVAQRHESEECRRDTSEACEPLRYRFPIEALDEAAKARRPTAWRFDGQSIVEPGQGYLAVSHVWSDGTGTGAWLEREVNGCLYDYFAAVARRFQCEGIWWDTICIPKDKAARSIAVNLMHRNYQDARVTFVHDCYLREWPWFDGESACIAILLSPWYSRGWSALELANAIKVKIAFKDGVIKDLDEDILANSDTCTPRHKFASRIISILRRGIVTTIDDLLSILQSRNTSWPRDMATIAGLLTGVENTSDATQQRIFQDILRKIGTISADHLFHNSPVMSDPAFGWCPANFLDMEVSSTGAPLRINRRGHVSGRWMVILNVKDMPQSRYAWRGTHPLTEMQLRSVLQQPDDCLLLVDLPVENQELTVARALLVETLGGSPLKHRALGSVYFHPPLAEEDIPGRLQGPMDIIIGYDGGPPIASKPQVIDNADLGFQDQDGWTALHQAIWQCNVPLVEKLIDRFDHEVEDRFGQRPLHVASERGSKNIVELLLVRGADLTVQCSQKQTPLHRAAWGGSFAVTEMLLEAGADPDALDSRGQSPLHLAAQHGYVEVASLLMKRSDASILNSEGFMALHLALLEGHNDVVKRLVRENDDLHSTDGRGYTVLHLAARTGNVDLVKWLVSKGSNTALRNSNGLRPVHLAAESGNDAALRWLLRREHVDSDPVVDETWEMLHSASKGGIEWIVSDILHGDESRINIRDPQGRSALHVAAGAGRTQMVRLLLDAKLGADVDAVDNSDQTPLFYAGNNGHVSVAKELIRRGANITVVDANGETPFLHAAINNHVPVLKLLLKNGAALGLKDQKRISSAQRDADYGLHPNTTVAVWVSNEVRIKADLLQRVVMNGHQEVLRVLFENDVDEKTFHLEKILVRENLKIKDLLLKDAVEHGQDSIIRLLLEQGADMDVNKSGYPWNRDRPLMAWASMKGHLSTVKLLLSNKADADPRGGYVPLVSAAYSGHEDIVRLLLKAKANINRICKFSFHTALSAAASNGHTATVKLLLSMGADTDPCRERGHTRPQGDSRHDELCAVPIVAAAKGGYQEIVRLLVKNKAIIDSVMVDTRDTGEYLTALSAAARNGDLEMVQFLVKSGACLAPKPIYGEHVTFPLESAARFGHEAVIDFLLQGRTDVNLPIWGASLTGAARHGHTKVVELLIRKGAHVDQPTTDSPIAAAILKRHDSIIKLLIQNGCSANAMSINVYTALSAAAYVGDVDTTQWLLLAGAKVDQPTNYPPIYEAASQGYDKIVKLLIQGGADVNSRASDQYNCLIRATQRNFYEVVKVLVECDAVVNARGFLQESAIATAAKNGNLDIMRLLIRYGADINAAGQLQEKAIVTARRTGNDDMLALLADGGLEACPTSG
ncbi:hypothetical protein CDV36_003677 [Fusarium kuroshium]|uniref:Heterokaryon incompatibility domain-containing protein n=1 Tax=Fusarium kuroshium TaxID=2010991 RepID=A0A3M2SGJ1_9HYPO|nr:hypothetical protein CDV36_003677 [Fusarium kuroshium]